MSLKTSMSAFAILGALLCGCSFFQKNTGATGASTTTTQNLPTDCTPDVCRTLPFVNTLATATTFDLFANNEHQLGPASRSVKFFIDTRSATPSIYYINSNYTYMGQIPESAKMHYDFALAYLQIPESATDYNQHTYFTNDKRYFAGSIQRYSTQAATGKSENIWAIQFFPQDIIAEATIVRAVEFIVASFGAHLTDQSGSSVNDRLVFVATGSQQSALNPATVTRLQGLGVEFLTIDSVLGSTNYLSLNPGEAWGYLRVFPSDQGNLSALDIVVFDRLPLDLTVVAGVITKQFQDPNSHVNLKSRERSTPNMMLREASLDHPQLRDLVNKPVKLIVRPEGFTLTETSAEEVAAKHAARMTKPWLAMQMEAATDPIAFSDMCPIDPAWCQGMKAQFGAKAANLAFLSHKDVLGRVEDVGSPSAAAGYDLSPAGVAVPLSFYSVFINAPENSSLKAALEEFIAAEKSGSLTPATRSSLAATLREGILAATIPSDILAKVQRTLAETLPGIDKVKVRSSANSEDLSGFNGAGLYDSYRAEPNNPADSSQCVVKEKTSKSGTPRLKVVPNTLACAIKAVYASLWNLRAIDERTFARIDHATAAMGLAIVPAYNIHAKIAANAVVVTRVPNARTFAGYSLSINERNNLVTNPAPGTWSEISVAMLLTADTPTSLTYTRFAKPLADGPVRTSPVLTREQALKLTSIAKTVELAWCKANPLYYPAAHEGRATCEYTVWDEMKPRALDFEFKLLENGQFVTKQVREFSGRN